MAAQMREMVTPQLEENVLRTLKLADKLDRYEFTEMLGGYLHYMMSRDGANVLINFTSDDVISRGLVLQSHSNQR